MGNGTYMDFTEVSNHVITTVNTRFQSVVINSCLHFGFDQTDSDKIRFSVSILTIVLLLLSTNIW